MIEIETYVQFSLANVHFSIIETKVSNNANRFESAILLIYMKRNCKIDATVMVPLEIQDSYVRWDIFVFSWENWSPPVVCGSCSYSVIQADW